MQLSLNSYILLCMLLHCCMDPRYTHQFQYGSPCPPIQPHKGRHSRSLDPAELSKEILHSVCMEHCIISNLHNKSHCSCKGWIGIHRSQFHSVVRSSLVHTHRCSPLENSIKHRLNYASISKQNSTYTSLASKAYYSLAMHALLVSTIIDMYRNLSVSLTKNSTVQ